MPAVELDKTLTGPVGLYGTIQIRVVVLKPRAEPPEEAASPPDGSEDGAETDEGGPSPLSTYLERKRYGKQCVVFLVNGQRHDAWDNTFIVRNLGFKYLRTRTMIVIDLDGLTNETIADIVQGSRQGLYEGSVMNAIFERMVATLKRDPDLVRLQSEAEQEISELRAGDETVRQRLDELIDSHHSAGPHWDEGSVEPGSRHGSTAFSFGKDKRQDVVVQSLPDVGESASYPVMVAIPGGSVIRLRPGTERVVNIQSVPESAWTAVEAFDFRVQPAVDELNIVMTSRPTGVELRLKFDEPDRFDVDEYPVETTVTAIAKFKERMELRTVERDIVINRRRVIPPPPPPGLRVAPTFLRVVSRQPVRLIPGGPAAHVRMAWDGHDSLTAGTTPPWRFQARCSTIGSFPPIGFSAPYHGKFELLLDTPHGLLPEQRLDFEVEALGPSGQRFLTTFSGQIAELPEEPEPRKITTEAPEPTGQRHPPYALKFVTEAEWGSPTCWAGKEWTKDDPGSFSEPTESAPLTLIINQDAEPVRVFREDLVERNLDESTVKERVSRYTTHVAFHLYQMYHFTKARRDEQVADEAMRVPDDDDNRQEIGRVATTLLRVMAVSR